MQNKTVTPILRERRAECGNVLQRIETGQMRRALGSAEKMRSIALLDLGQVCCRTVS
jgi:hypothetical protein